MTEELVLPNVYGIVRSGDRNEPSILIQKRWKPETDPTNTGGWELPGGKWRAWESAHDCLRREVLEETGIEIDSVDGRLADAQLNGQVVQRTESAAVVQMLQGPYPSIIVIHRAVGHGEPVSRGDGSRDAQWMPAADLHALLQNDPTAFTPLSYSALTGEFASTGEETK